MYRGSNSYEIIDFYSVYFTFGTTRSTWYFYLVSTLKL
uniref:Uncharacterized protein n=1 Tax=Arundo donax TaxID=35708 RepID=A0A0A8ZJ75_ARUDO